MCRNLSSLATALCEVAWSNIFLMHAAHQPKQRWIARLILLEYWLESLLHIPMVLVGVLPKYFLAF